MHTRNYLLLWLAGLLLPIHFSAQILDATGNVWRVTERSLLHSLNGDWKFRFLPSPDWSRYRDFCQTDFDDSEWETIPVPGNWDILGYTTPRYGNPDNLTGLYRTCFGVPDGWKGQRVILRFDGVLRGYELWVNGHPAGKWESSHHTCQFDITPYLQAGENTLAVRVYTHYKGFDFDGNDDWAQVGIHRNVWLMAVPDTHIKDLTVQTFLKPENRASVQLNFEVAASGPEMARELFIKGKLLDPLGNMEKEFTLPVGHSQEAETELSIEKPMLWNAETPHLYSLHYSLVSAGKELQCFTEKVGIREVTIDGTVFKVNSTAIKLRGVTLHETDPFHGKVVGEEVNLTDLRMMKEANINFIRTTHYPRDPRFYELCDSIGMYVMSEVPFGYGSSNLSDPGFQDILLTRADATVRRDKNHPCILIWSIGNENPLTPIAEETGRYVKSMDPTRPICYPMEHSYFLELNYHIPDFVDIYAPHYPPVATLKHYAETARRPVILTEYCHSLGQSLEEHKELWELIEAHSHLAGGNVWEWVDQGMPKASGKRSSRLGWTNDLWLNDSTCISMEGNAGADGILYADRTPLPNYYEVRKNYAQVMIPEKEISINHDQEIRFTLHNRFDFVDLKDKVQAGWFITSNKDTLYSGRFIPHCGPGKQTVVTLNPTGRLDTDKVNLLHLNIYTNDGYCINTHVIGLTGTTDPIDYTDRLSATQRKSLKPEKVWMRTKDLFSHPRVTSLIQEPPLIRAGRKLSMSEQVRVSRQVVNNYLLRANVSESEYPKRKKQSAIQQKCIYQNQEISIDAAITYTINANYGVAIHFDATPIGSDKLLLEAGIAFLLDKDITKVQWLGNGPYASYPGKNSANNRGMYALCQDDLYFEGNRQGVDLVLCTKDNGDGILLVCNQGSVNFEQTDKGIVLTYNSLVSGLGGKLRTTAFPVYAHSTECFSGDLSLYFIKGDNWPSLLTDLFVLPDEIKAPYHPFYSVFDTYLLRFNDIIEGDIY
ncbi:MAG: hypothetical protein LIP08_05695 [Bacteroides sp.]|nr:hypothetical protein [Bacteroides sp.]